MGGSFTPHAENEDVFTLQFIHSPRVEFNCRFDPEAVEIMLHAGWRKITVVPFDPCVRAILTPELLKRATASGRAAAAGARNGHALRRWRRRPNPACCGQ